MAVDTRIGGPNDGEDRYKENGTDRSANEAEKSLIEVVEQHDSAAKALFKTLEDVADKPDLLVPAVPVLNKQCSTVIQTFRGAIDILAKEHSGMSAPYLESVCALWVGDERSRVEFLGSITPEGDYVELHNGDVEAMKRGILRQYDEYTESNDELSDDEKLSIITGIYARSLLSDIETFTQALGVKQYMNRSEGQEDGSLAEADDSGEILDKKVARSKMRTIGKHTLDVAKLAAGVGLGVALGNFARGSQPRR